MADPFVAEIRIFSFDFAPTGWAFCDGQLLPIAQNTALFSLLGTTYGGDGRTTFALPNLRGAAPMHAGQGPGLSQRALGERGGTEAVTLPVTQVPSHTHNVQCNVSAGGQVSPANNLWGQSIGGQRVYSTNAAPAVQMDTLALSATGGGSPHNNLPPYLVLSFCIALQGVFPPRS